MRENHPKFAGRMYEPQKSEKSNFDPIWQFQFSHKNDAGAGTSYV